MRVFVKNIEPAWIKYGLVVTIPDETSEEDFEEAVLEECYSGRYDVEWGPEFVAAVSGLDQEFVIGEVVDE